MEKNKNLFLMSLLVTDAADALSRFCGVLGRWGCPLESMHLTADRSGLQRLTVIVGGDAHRVDRIVQQTARLCTVRSVSLPSARPLSSDETLHLSLQADSLSHAAASRLCASHGAMICGRTEDALLIEMTGDPASLALFLDAAAPYGIVGASVSNVSTFPVEEMLRAAF